jgi:threonine dehydrogenase-like Zn-dependent dehydrogenase
MPGKAHGAHAYPDHDEIIYYMNGTGINAKDMITHQFAIDEIHEAMKTFTERIDGALKVVVRP